MLVVAVGDVCDLCVSRYVQTGICDGMLLNWWDRTAGGQEEFQIFDKHVSAVKPRLVITPVLLLPVWMQGD